VIHELAFIQFSVLSCQFSVLICDGRRLTVDRQRPLSVFDRFPESFLVERARVNVRAKGRGVNSVFLVQLRKMFATDFHGLVRIVNLVEGVTLRRTESAGSVGENAGGGNFCAVAGMVVHTGCTGNAERQWAVNSGQ
jgi:hypothetical protein